MKAGDHLYLVDGSAFIHRAFHVHRTMFREPDRMPVGAVFGFCNMMWGLLNRAQFGATRTPTHFAVIFDHGRKSTRHGIYPDYKANRKPLHEDLVPQMSLVREATRAFNVPAIEMAGVEADDLIATYATIAVEEGAEVSIISSDKDLMQLVGPQVMMLDTLYKDDQGNRSRWIGIKEVIEKFGVAPTQLRGVLALMGDAVDNIPGVKSIGEKTAAGLIKEFGSIHALVQFLEEDDPFSPSDRIPKKTRAALLANVENMLMSLALVELDGNVDVPAPIDDFIIRGVDGPRLVKFLHEMGFVDLPSRVAKAMGMDI